MVAEFWVLQRVWGCCRMGWTRGVGVKIVVVCVCIMWHGRKLGSVGGGVLRNGGLEWGGCGDRGGWGMEVG